jgi:uncharacterized membrane protein YraQ (UPF0718 family)
MTTARVRCLEAGYGCVAQVCARWDDPRVRVPARRRSRLLLVASAFLFTSTAVGVTAFVLWRTGFVGDTTFWGMLLASGVLGWISSLLVLASAVFRGSGPWHSGDSLHSAKDSRAAPGTGQQA